MKKRKKINRAMAMVAVMMTVLLLMMILAIMLARTNNQTLISGAQITSIEVKNKLESIIELGRRQLQNSVEFGAVGVSTATASGQTTPQLALQFLPTLSHYFRSDGPIPLNLQATTSNGTQAATSWIDAFPATPGSAVTNDRQEILFSIRALTPAITAASQVLEYEYEIRARVFDNSAKASILARDRGVFSIRFGLASLMQWSLVRLFRDGVNGSTGGTEFLSFSSGERFYGRIHMNEAPYIRINATGGPVFYDVLSFAKNWGGGFGDNPQYVASLPQAYPPANPVNLPFRYRVEAGGSGQPNFGPKDIMLRFNRDVDGGNAPPADSAVQPMALSSKVGNIQRLAVFDTEGVEGDPLSFDDNLLTDIELPAKFATNIVAPVGYSGVNLPTGIYISSTAGGNPKGGIFVKGDLKQFRLAAYKNMQDLLDNTTNEHDAQIQGLFSNPLCPIQTQTIVTDSDQRVAVYTSSSSAIDANCPSSAQQLIVHQPALASPFQYRSFTTAQLNDVSFVDGKIKDIGGEIIGDPHDVNHRFRPSIAKDHQLLIGATNDVTITSHIAYSDARYATNDRVVAEMVDPDQRAAYVDPALTPLSDQMVPTISRNSQSFLGLVVGQHQDPTPTNVHSGNIFLKAGLTTSANDDAPVNLNLHGAFMAAGSDCQVAGSQKACGFGFDSISNVGADLGNLRVLGSIAEQRGYSIFKNGKGYRRILRWDPRFSNLNIRGFPRANLPGVIAQVIPMGGWSIVDGDEVSLN